MIPEIEELYQEVILDHSRRPRNFGELPDAAVRVHGDNPACGDEIHLAVKFDSAGGLEDIKFTGRGCAISQASASLMTMKLKGKSRAEVMEMLRAFHNLVTGDTSEAPKTLGDLRVMQGVRKFPRRLLKFTIKASRTASPPMKPVGDLRKISRRGFKPLLVVIPPLLRKSTAKSSGGPALDRTGTGNVIGASANFRCTSIATGDVEGWVIYCSLVSSAKRNGWGCGNCYRASFLSTRPVARFAANTDFVRSACTRNMRALMVAGLTS